MTNVTAVLSMLHESANANSATRTFRQDPVLTWTLHRLSRCKNLANLAILCWEDQALAVAEPADEAHAHMLVKGPRQSLSIVESIAAAQKFADGWRGGLQSTCEFDRGFYAPWVKEIAEHLQADGLLLIDPAAGLVDSEIIDALIEQAGRHEQPEIFFTQAAPGVAGALIRLSLLDRLAKLNTHPGKLLHYMPDQPARDPIGGESCVAVPTAVARTTRRFTLDSSRQIERITAAAISLNGTLVSSGAHELLNRLDAHRPSDSLPRDLTVELTTRRETKPIFSPLRSRDISRPDLTLESADRLFRQLADYDDTRITFGGVGDPLLNADFLEIIAAARAAGINAIHVETDLLVSDTAIEQLVDIGVDVVSVHLPATQAATYARLMGVDRMADVVGNIKRFVTHRQLRRRGVPLLVPTFVKLPENLAEMEAWYDQWLRALGSAVIVGASDFAGQFKSLEIADMQPPKRTACRRIQSRLMILSDGAIVSCEQDVLGKHAIGNIHSDTLHEVWTQRIASLRTDHECGNWKKHALCGACKEWHRP